MNGSRYAGLFWKLLFLIPFAMVGTLATAQESFTPDELKRLSVDQLMNIDVGFPTFRKAH